MTGSTAIDDLDASRGHDKDGDSFHKGCGSPADVARTPFL